MSRRLNFHRFSCGLRRLVHISSMFKIILVPTECVHIENNNRKKQTLEIDNLIVGCTANDISSEEKIRNSRKHNYAYSIRCLIVDWLHEAKRIVALNSSCFVFWCGVRDTSNYVSDIAFRTALPLPLLCFAWASHPKQHEACCTLCILHTISNCVLSAHFCMEHSANFYLKDRSL